MTRSNHPQHDLRDVRRQLTRLLDDVDGILARLADPDQRPDIGDYRAPVAIDGKPYRVQTRVHAPGTEEVQVTLRPESGDET